MKRVLLKLSGEALAGEKHTGFDEATVLGVAKQVKTLVDDGIQVGIVIGGGNFWRGRTSENMERTKACLLYTSGDYAAEQKDIEKLGENHVFFLPYLMGGAFSA